MRPAVINRFMLPLVWFVALAASGYAAALLFTRHVNGDTVEYSFKLHENDPRVVASQIQNVQPFRLVAETADVQAEPRGDLTPKSALPLPEVKLVGVLTGMDNAPGFAMLGINDQPAQVVMLNDEPLPGLMLVALHPGGVDVLWHDVLHHVPVVFSSPQNSSSLPSPRAAQRPVRR